MSDMIHKAAEQARLRIQALGAALSRRDWHATERAYEAIRDAHDAALAAPEPNRHCTKCGVPLRPDNEGCAGDPRPGTNAALAADGDVYTPKGGDAIASGPEPDPTAQPILDTSPGSKCEPAGASAAELVERLKAWGPLVSSGYECPAAGTAMHEAAAAIERLTQALAAVRELEANQPHAKTSTPPSK